MENALDPFRGRHQPRQLLGEIDSRLASEAELAPVVRKTVNAQAHSGIVEKDVARLEDGFVQPHDTMRALSKDPALELAAIESGVAGAKSSEVFRRILVLQHGCSGDDLENRPWSKLRLNRAIEQRLLPILVEIFPVVCRDAHREVIGVQRGMAHHRQDFSGARVESDCRTRTWPQGLLGSLLEVVVDSQLDLLAGNGFLSGQTVHFFADAVHHHAAHTVRTLKQVVVLAFKAGLSREVSGA